MPKSVAGTAAGLVSPAPYVGTNLDIIHPDAFEQRGARPFVFTDMHRRIELDDVISFIEAFFSTD